MRLVKVVAVLVVGLVLVVIGGAVALFAWVDPSAYRAPIERAVAERTGREFHIAGPIELKLFPWLSLSVRDATLGNPQRFGAGPFAVARQASIGVRLLPLLRSRLEVSRVAVDGLAITLLSRGDDDNWSDLGQALERGRGGSQPGASVRRTSIAGIDLHGASIVWRDLDAGLTWHLGDLELRTDAIEGDRPVKTTLSFVADRGGPIAVAKLQLEALARLPAGESRVELANVALTGEWYERSGSSTATGSADSVHSLLRDREPVADIVARPIRVVAPSLDLDWDRGALAPATLDVKIGDLPARLTVSGERLFGDRLVSGRIEVPEFSPRQLLPTLGVGLPATADETALSKASLDAAWRLTPSGIAFADIDGTLDDTKIAGSASLDTTARATLRFELQSGVLDLDRYLPPPEADAGAAGTSRSSGPARLPFDVLRGFDAAGALRAERVRFAGLDFGAVRVPIDLREGVLRADATEASLFGGAWRGLVVVDARPAAAQVSLDGRMHDVDVGGVVRSLFDSDRLAGRGDATVRLAATGSSRVALLRSLSGRLDFDVRDGALRGIDLWYELRRARALVRRETLPVSVASDRTPFQAFRGSAVLDAGVMRSDDFTLQTEFVKARGAGTLRIDTGAVDYRLVAALYRMPASADAGAEMADLKAAEIPIAITGTLGDLNVRPDVEAAVASRVRQKLQDATHSVEGELRTKLGKKLRGLLGSE